MMDVHGMKKAVAATAGANGSADGGASKAEQMNSKRIVSPDEAIRSALGPFDRVIRRGLPKSIDPVDFTGALINEVIKSPKLIRAATECPESLIGAAIQSKQLGLEINSQIGQSYLVPYFEKDKVASEAARKTVWKMRVAMQFGYQGVLKLCYNSGEVIDIDAMEVYEKDYFEYRFGMNKTLEHVPYAGADRGNVKAYYAIVNLKSGGTIFRVWGADQVVDHAKKFSKSYNKENNAFSGPWKDSFDSMAKKTVLLDVLKYTPKSADFSARVNAENTTKSVSAEDVNIDMLSHANEEFIDGKAQEVESIETVEMTAKEVADGIRSQFNLMKGSDIATKQKQRTAGGNDDTAIRSELKPEFVK